MVLPANNSLAADDGFPGNIFADSDKHTDETNDYPLNDTSSLQKWRFAAGMAGYHIIRLSVELLLILRIQELDWNISEAGLIFLLYSLASVAGSLHLLWFPSLFLGSSLRAWMYLVLTMGAACIGFVFAFNVQIFWTMALFASASAWGTSVWSTNYQTIVNLAFSPADMGEISRIAQMFECIGFLVPSIAWRLLCPLPTSSWNKTRTPLTQRKPS